MSNKQLFVGITVHVDEGQNNDLYPGHPLFYVERETIELVKEIGLIPYLIPVYRDGTFPPLEHLQGIILTGGGYLNLNQSNSQLTGLQYTGRERFYAEMNLINYSMEKDLPLIGFCRGAQMINKVLGGTLDNISNAECEHHQERINLPPNKTVHDIVIAKDSKFFNIIGESRLPVNSLHRQYMRTLGEGLLPVATSSPDQYTEVFESSLNTFLFGFQFHPEKLWKIEPKWLTFFQSFADCMLNRCNA